MTSTLAEAIFELACATDGWFYFSPWTASPDGGSTVAVEAVVEEILPRLEEWRELQATIPIDALVSGRRRSASSWRPAASRLGRPTLLGNRIVSMKPGPWWLKPLWSFRQHVEVSK